MPQPRAVLIVQFITGKRINAKRPLAPLLGTHTANNHRLMSVALTAVCFQHDTVA
jgi:hypothetical protein